MTGRATLGDQSFDTCVSVYVRTITTVSKTKMADKYATLSLLLLSSLLRVSV